MGSTGTELGRGWTPGLQDGRCGRGPGRVPRGDTGAPARAPHGGSGSCRSHGRCVCWPKQRRPPHSPRPSCVHPPLGRRKAGSGRAGAHCPHVRSSSAPAIVPGVGPSASAGVWPVGQGGKGTGGGVPMMPGRVSRSPVRAVPSRLEAGGQRSGRTPGSAARSPGVVLSLGATVVRTPPGPSASLRPPLLG